MQLPNRRLLRSASAAALPAASTFRQFPQDSHESGEQPFWRRGVVGTLVRRWRLVAVCTAIGLLCGVASVLATPPVYRARTSLQLEAYNETFLQHVTPVRPILDNAPAESYVRNQLSVLQSEALARRVAEQLERYQPARNSGPSGMSLSGMRGTPPSKDQQRIAAFREAMKARIVPNSQIIEILYDAPSPDLAARGANTTANEFIGMNRESRWEMIQETTVFLARQTVDLKAKLEAATRKLQDFARSSGLTFTMAQQAQTPEQERMRQLQESLARAEAERAAKQSRYEAALGNSTDNLPEELVRGPLRQYQEDLQGLRRQLAELRAVYTPAHHRVARIQAQISDLEAAIERERRAVIERLQTDYKSAAGLERILAQTNARQLGTLQLQAAREAEYNMLRREVDSTQQLYEDVLRKANEAGVASAMRATNIRVIDPARPPFHPHSPNLPLNVAGGLFFGVVGGSGLALFRERSSIVRRPGDAMALRFLELGVIPSAKDAHRLAHPWRPLIGAPESRSELALATSRDRSDLFNESFRWALTSLLFSAGLENGTGRMRGVAGRPSGGKVLLVSSTEAMEGKTTVLSNLGIVLAQTNRRVLLVDADLRKPRLHEVFDVQNGAGLTDFLRDPGATALEALVQPTRVDGLWLLPSGPTDDRVAQLLYSANLNTLLRRLRREFDLVLVDSAPMALFPDGRVLGRLSDGVVLVVRANRARTDVLNALRTQLVQDEIPLLGTILNDWRLDPSQLRNYGGYYKRYNAAAG